MPADRNAPSPRAGGGASLARGMTVTELAQLLGAQLQGDERSGTGVRVTGVRQDSRRVEAGDLFVALSGARADGARFVSDAVRAGAAAVLIELGRTLEAPGVPVLGVERPREALARAAAALYGRPTEALRVVGITGTNGKTTTAHLLRHALDAAGARTAVLGTLGGAFEDVQLASGLTSPEVDDLMRFADAVRVRGATHLVMEVSSIALESERVAEVDFDVAVFTNLTQDHLDFHGNMRAYAEAKRRLFLEHRPRLAVVNVDDPFGQQLAEALSGSATDVWTVSARGIASVSLRRLEVDAGGMSMSVHTPTGEVELRAPLIGRHNALNVLTAVAIVAALELDVKAAAKAFASAPQVPGRLELCSQAAHDDIVAVVDYAHTPDALARVLESLREVCSGRLHCVFGCGGDRDPAKRGPMGTAVAEHADVAIVTNDNPRSEDPAHIADAVVAGVRGSSPSMDLRVELDRARAIQTAVASAAPGDVVVVAGKGHETYQIFADRVIDFDDRLELGRALAARRGTEGAR